MNRRLLVGVLFASAGTVVAQAPAARLGVPAPLLEHHRAQLTATLLTTDPRRLHASGP